MDTPAPHSAPAAPVVNTASPRRRITVSITTRTLVWAALVAIGLLAVLLLITHALGPVILLMLAIILGEAIRPLVARLKLYHVPGPLAVMLIYLVTVVFLSVVIWLLINPLVADIGTFTKNLPHYVTQIQTGADDIQRRLRTQGTLSTAIDNVSRSLAGILQQSVPSLLSVPLQFLSGIFTVFIDLIVILTMTLFWLSSSTKLKTFVVGLFPPRSQAYVESVIGEVGKGFGGYVRGTLISMVLIGLFTGLGLALLGVPYAVLLGVLAGLTELLPYLGPWISGSVAVLVSLIAVDPLKAIEVVVLFLLIQQIEGNAVQPLVMSRSVHVDPLLVIVSVLIGISLLGVVGAILAVPIAAGLQVLVVRVVAPAIRGTSGASDYTVPHAEAQAVASGSSDTTASPSAGE